MKYNLKNILLYGGFSFLLGTNPAAASLKEAMQALSEQDYTFALEEFGRLSMEENNAEAKYQLGCLYEKGQGVEKDLEMALTIFKKAGNDGNGKAALKVGNAYYLGENVSMDKAEALKWFLKAADAGNYSAQYNVGLMYEEGKNVKKDYIKAHKYYTLSGEQGYEPAQHALGKLYLNGQGTPQDYGQAIFWHKLAANQGSQEAQLDLAKLYANTSVRGLPFNIVGAHIYFNLVSAYGVSPEKENAATFRDELTKTMKNEDVVLAQLNARKWKKKTREESLPKLYRNESLIGEEDRNFKQKKTAETEEIEKKEKLIVTVDTNMQDLMLASGIQRRTLNKAVRSDDFSEIVSILTEKSNEENVIASLALAELYMLGQGIEENPKAAFDIYKKLTKDNDFIAYYKIAPMYCEGNSVEPDLVECYKNIVLAERFSDKDSLASIKNTKEMLDQNLEQEIRDSGLKAAEDSLNTPKNEKKGMFSNFLKKDDNKEDKKEKKEKQKKATEEADEFFPDL